MLLIKVVLIKKHVTSFSKDEEITLSHEFIFDVFHWGNIVKKVLSKAWGLEKNKKVGNANLFSNILGKLKIKKSAKEFLRFDCQ